MKKIKLSLLQLNHETISKLQEDQMRTISGGNDSGYVRTERNCPIETKQRTDECKPEMD